MKRKNKFLSNNSSIKLLNDISEKTLTISPPRQSRKEILEENQRERSGYLSSKSYTHKNMKEYPDAFCYDEYWRVFSDEIPDINIRTNLSKTPFNRFYVNTRWLKKFETLKDVDYLKEKLLSSYDYPSFLEAFMNETSSFHPPYRPLTSWIICRGTVDTDIELKFWEPHYKENLQYYFTNMVSWAREFASYEFRLKGNASKLKRISDFVNNNIEYDRSKDNFYEQCKYLDYNVYKFLSANLNKNFSSKISLFSPIESSRNFTCFKNYVVYFTQLRTLLQLNYLACSPLERFLLLDDSEVTPEFFATILFTNDIIREAFNFVSIIPKKGDALKDMKTLEEFGWAAVVSYLMKEFKKSDFCILNDDGGYSFNEELYNERIAAYSDIFNQLKSPELYPHTKKYLVSDEFVQFLNTKNRRFKLTDLSIEDWKDLIEEVKSSI